jgi:N-acetylmuramoyl-L-alanine amidase
MLFGKLPNIQRLLILFVVCGTCFGAPIEAFSQKGSKIRTVVIDAGHGGKDPGAVGKYSKEKDIVLAVALKTGKYIEQNLPDVKVIYTRKRDEFIELHRRAAIANENNADVFISIHCNASKSRQAYGAETFVMGEHRSEANLEVAMLENKAILFEENQEEEYGGFDPANTAAYIALNLVQSEHKAQSIKLAQKVQQQFTERVGRKDRSVQQAGFLVLYRTAMPSILVELGFITHPSEEAFLKSEEGQVYMASAIFRAFKEFKTEYELENAPPIRQQLEKATKEVEARNNTNTQPSAQKETSKPAVQQKSDVVFRVQFATYQNKIELTDKRFKGIETPWSYFHNGLWKYTSGSFTSYEQALKHLEKLKKTGFQDAFVVAFEGNNRISIDQAGMKK